MLSKLKIFVLHIVVGIGMGCTFFVAAGLIGNAIWGTYFIAQLANDFARQALGAILVGSTFGVTSMIYRAKQLLMWQKIVIHLSVSMGFFFVVAFRLGWLPSFSPLLLTLSVICILLIALFIWLGFYLYCKQEAYQINKRIKEIEANDAK